MFDPIPIVRIHLQIVVQQLLVIELFLLEMLISRRLIRGEKGAIKNFGNYFGTNARFTKNITEYRHQQFLCV